MIPLRLAFVVLALVFFVLAAFPSRVNVRFEWLGMAALVLAYGGA